jgi:hypothetical protein
VKLGETKSLSFDYGLVTWCIPLRVHQDAKCQESRDEEGILNYRVHQVGKQGKRYSSGDRCHIRTGGCPGDRSHTSIGIRGGDAQDVVRGEKWVSCPGGIDAISIRIGGAGSRITPILTIGNS